MNLNVQFITAWFKVFLVVNLFYSMHHWFVTYLEHTEITEYRIFCFWFLLF